MLTSFWWDVKKFKLIKTNSISTFTYIKIRVFFNLLLVGNTNSQKQNVDKYFNICKNAKNPNLELF